MAIQDFYCCCKLCQLGHLQPKRLHPLTPLRLFKDFMTQDEKPRVQNGQWLDSLKRWSLSFRPCCLEEKIHWPSQNDCLKFTNNQKVLPAALAERHQDGQLVMGVFSKPMWEMKQELLQTYHVGLLFSNGFSSKGIKCLVVCEAAEFLYPLPLSRWIMKVSFPNFSNVS